VGTTIGGNKLTDYSKKEHALEEFKEVYLKQTGNEWKDRKTSTKRPNKFYPLEMDYGDEVFFFCFVFVLFYFEPFLIEVYYLNLILEIVN
jgi:hypothetical protein